MKTTEAILDRLADDFPDLSPQLRRAADYVLHNPNEAGALHAADRFNAEVTPNTLVRLAQALGLRDTAFLDPFSERPSKRGGFFDRARYSNRWRRAAATVSSTGIWRPPFRTGTARVTPDEVEARKIARPGDLHSRGRQRLRLHLFWYTGRMALDTRSRAAPWEPADDDIGRIDERDVLFAMTFGPIARRRWSNMRGPGAIIVAISDSRTSPIALRLPPSSVPTTTLISSPFPPDLRRDPGVSGRRSTGRRGEHQAVPQDPLRHGCLCRGRRS